MSLLLTLSRSAFAIEPNAAEKLLPVVQRVMEGDSITAEELGIKQTSFFDAYQPDGNIMQIRNGREAFMPGTVAVVNLSGPIMKEDFCGAPGTASYLAINEQLAFNKNVSALVYVVDSPGGELAGTPQLAASIKRTSKPTIAYISDMSASAGYWIASAADEVYISSPNDEVGSIGVYTRLIKRTEQQKQVGIEVIEVYAPQSTEKNADYREALDGKPQKLQAVLGKHAGEFIKQVGEHRKGKIKDTAVFKGGIYVGSDAIDVGLADGMKTFSEVMARAKELSNKVTVTLI